METRIKFMTLRLILTFLFLTLSFIFIQRKGSEVFASLYDSGYQYGGCLNTGDPWCSAAFPKTNVVWNSYSFPAHGTVFNLGSTINATGTYAASHWINNTVTPAYDIADSHTVWLERDAGGCEQVLYFAPMAVYSNSSAPSGSVTSPAGGTFTIPTSIDLAMCGTSWRINLSAQNKPSPNANDTIGYHAIGEHITLSSGSPAPSPSGAPTPAPTPSGGPSPSPAGVIDLTITDALPERTIGSNDSTVYNFTVGGSCATPHTLVGNVFKGADRLPHPTVTVNLSTTSVVSGDSGTAEVITNSTPLGTDYTLKLSISRGICGQDLKAANFDVVAAAPTPTPTPSLPPPPPWPPSPSLTATYSCAAGQPVVAFSWSNASGEDGYYLDVSSASSWTTWGFKQLGANVTSFTWNTANPLSGGPPNAPANSTTYWFRVVAYNTAGQSPHLYDWNPGADSFTSPGAPQTTPNCAPTPPPPPTPTPTPTPPPPPPPTAPINLTATASCVSGQPQILFTWDDATGETGYYLDVNLAAWTGPGSPSPWGVATLSANTISFTWNASAPLSGGPPTVPVNSTTYWWRLKAFNTGGESPHIYPPNSLTPPGTSVTTPNCAAPSPPPVLDLKARFVKPFSKQSFAAGETATATIRVRNIGGVGAAATTLGVWPTGSPFPNCPGSPVNPLMTGGQSYPVNALAPGASQEIAISFNVGSTPGTFTANGYVIPACNQLDGYWGNNATNGSGQVGEVEDVDATVGGFSYTVVAIAWFETFGGDVGARGGTIAVSLTSPPPSRYQSSYLAVATGDLVNIVTRGGWRIKNYTGGLVPSGGIYTYLAERFRQKAIDEGYDASHPSGTCLINAGSIPDNKKFAYCSGHAEFDVGGGPTGQQVWFIDGNLTIRRDLELVGTDTITFIVKGNIIIETDVERADGIYITDGTFADTDLGGGNTGATLKIYGAVYGRNVNLARVLATGNDLNPAEQIIFDPKYLISLNTLLGSPSFSWREVAP